MALFRVYNIVPFDAEVLSAATFGDIETMRALLERQLASPFDVSLEGDSALIVSALATYHVCFGLKCSSGQLSTERRTCVDYS